MLYSLSRKEGWRRYVEAPARERPAQLLPGQLKQLGDAAREEYDEARHDWHANFGILRTPQLAAVHEELDVIVAAGRCDPDRVRGAAVIDALPGLGKTTAANSFARGFDRAQIRRHGPLTGEGHERIPVFRVGLTSNTTLRTLTKPSPPGRTAVTLPQGSPAFPRKRANPHPPQLRLQAIRRPSQRPQPPTFPRKRPRARLRTASPALPAGLPTPRTRDAATSTTARPSAPPPRKPSPATQPCPGCCTTTTATCSTSARRHRLATPALRRAVRERDKGRCHHMDQLNTQATLLSQLDAAVQNFMADFPSGWSGRSPVIVIYSEFGRRAQANASGGTDHGSASNVIVVGPSVKGGFYSELPSLTRLDETDNLVHTVDFRRVYATVLADVMGVDPKSFLGANFAPIPFLQ